MHAASARDALGGTTRRNHLADAAPRDTRTTSASSRVTRQRSNALADAARRHLNNTWDAAKPRETRIGGTIAPGARKADFQGAGAVLCSHDEPRRQRSRTPRGCRLRCRPPLDAVHQRRDRPGPERVEVLAHRGQRRAVVGGIRDVVEARPRVTSRRHVAPGLGERSASSPSAIWSLAANTAGHGGLGRSATPARITADAADQSPRATRARRRAPAAPSASTPAPPALGQPRRSPRGRQTWCTVVCPSARRCVERRPRRRPRGRSRRSLKRSSRGESTTTSVEVRSARIRPSRARSVASFSTIAPSTLLVGQALEGGRTHRRRRPSVTTVRA